MRWSALFAEPKDSGEERSEQSEVIRKREREETKNQDCNERWNMEGAGHRWQGNNMVKNRCKGKSKREESKFLAKSVPISLKIRREIERDVHTTLSLN